MMDECDGMVAVLVGRWMDPVRWVMVDDENWTLTHEPVPVGPTMHVVVDARRVRRGPLATRLAQTYTKRCHTDNALLINTSPLEDPWLWIRFRTDNALLIIQPMRDTRPWHVMD